MSQYPSGGEHANPALGHDSESAKIVRLPVGVDVVLSGTVHTFEPLGDPKVSLGETIQDRAVSIRLWNDRDASLDDTMIESMIRDGVSLSRIRRTTTDPADYPVAIVEYLFGLARISPDIRDVESAKRILSGYIDAQEKMDIAEQQGRVIPKNLKNAKKPTSLELTIIDLHQALRVEVMQAIDKLRELREDDDRFKMYETLEEWEVEIMQAYGGSNIVRLYNELSSNSNQDDVLVAGRLLLTILRERMHQAVPNDQP